MTHAERLEGVVEEVVEGRDPTRLFLARAQGFDARALYGQPWDDVAQLERTWRASVRRWIDAAQDVGARLCMVLAPDAHALHADDLPEGMAFATPSLADRFVELFADTPGLELIHPREALKAARGPVEVFKRNDSHWTSFGAYAAYRMVMERVGQGARVLGADEVRYVWREETGDLGWIFDPPRRAAAPQAEVIAPRARVVLDRFDERRAALKVFEIDDASLPTCVVVRDSFATAMGPLLVESFRRTVMVGARERFFPEMLYDERPDVVILERAERTLPFGVVDWGPTTWREWWPDPGGDAQAHAADAQARLRLGSGDAAGALERASDAIQHECTPDRLFTLGRARMLSANPGGAAEAFAAALAAEPARWAFAFHLGLALQQAGRLAEARDLFARCCALAPWHPLGFERFGAASLALGDGASAEPALRTAARLGAGEIAPTLITTQTSGGGANAL